MALRADGPRLPRWRGCLRLRSGQESPAALLELQAKLLHLVALRELGIEPHGFGCVSASGGGAGPLDGIA
jgi:hypothetical protein